ncbi:isoprenyl transferase [Corynebacterium uberis]|uniref:isoprenyl transferase n=1 Tax=Corynebacterium TaxID=1716 RepID=UPI001D0A219E|nr:isoprenyl transferase [Corynebacterium uberis]MCZ9308880.1 isoprenyl transferase [Corynebacterium sp. c6VSa_13]UDL74643.1 isoprenyl transferase [Corynebacterium uberis]UDL76523.1 isoprenyl transferase [Corynebacterium uberis]UDL78735.1 isoprenyl transferase [Corynebacterium uberis]UDL81014.1 isoprenyl transferase [Corynebacterium uberis]
MRFLPRRLLYPLYEARLEKELKGLPQPKHVAVMCDGNRRWAREAGFDDVSHGHRVGARKIAEMIRWCRDTQVQVVTVYLLSTENLKRSPEELQLLFSIIGEVVDELAGADNDCRVRVVGHLDALPTELAQRMAQAEQATKDNPGVTVNVAVGYGGRQEIVDAVRALVAEKVAAGTPAEDLEESVTVDSISRHLYTSGQPDPDLVIRTSGEQRLSGFLLWQAAYSEIWFTDTYWPAFRRIDLLRALREYSKRSRRFGK